MAVLTTAGKTLSRGQAATRTCIDDATIMTRVMSRMLDNPNTADTHIRVETLNGAVMLCRGAKNATERDTAERIERDVSAVNNQFAIRP